MEAALLAINSQLASLNAKLDKIDLLEVAVNRLTSENVKTHEDLAAVILINKEKEAIITLQADQINRCEQALRANSIRILGLPITKETPAADIAKIAFDHVLYPILEAAKEKNELNSYPPLSFLVDQAFSIPAKKGTSLPVIIKLSSYFIRSLIFRHKKEILPKVLDPVTRTDRNTFSIFEDLSPANFTKLRSLLDDSRIKSAWSYNGQLKFKFHNSETVHRIKSLSDTADNYITSSPRP
jgi:hypothetical protein